MRMTVCVYCILRYRSTWCVYLCLRMHYTCMLLGCNFPLCSMSRIYPSLPTEDAIKAVAQKDHFTDLTTEEQSLLWNSRYSLPHILGNHPRGLPLFLLSLPDYSHTHLANVHAILDRWKLHEPTDALELLNVQYVKQLS